MPRGVPITAEEREKSALNYHALYTTHYKTRIINECHAQSPIIHFGLLFDWSHRLGTCALEAHANVGQASRVCATSCRP